MNVLHLNTFMAGGAASGAYRLHSALRRMGVNSKILVQSKTTADEDVIAVPMNFWEKIEDRFDHRVLSWFTRDTEQGKYYFLPMPFFSRQDDRILSAVPFRPDLLIVHWTTAFADVRTMDIISRRYNIPVIWYMSDMEPMTGGCHYAFDCNEFATGCCHCPAVRGLFQGYVRALWQKKKKYLANMRMAVIASSSFMLHKAQASGVFEGKSLALVWRGIDDKIFAPAIDRKALRAKWNVENDTIVLCFGSQSLKEKRKGTEVLIRALKVLYEKLQDDELQKRVEIVFAGGNAGIQKKLLFSSKYMGVLKTQQDLADMYRMADIFICPTLQDSGPMMVSEALMCGTPVVGFPMGVLQDVVLEGKTGAIAALGDSNELAAAMERMIRLPAEERLEMARQCRSFAMKNLTYQRQAEQVLRLAAAI